MQYFLILPVEKRQSHLASAIIYYLRNIILCAFKTINIKIITRMFLLFYEKKQEKKNHKKKK